MSRIDECYASLENVKKEVANLKDEKVKIDELWSQSVEFIDQVGEYTTLNDLFQRCESSYKSARNYLIKLFALRCPISVAIVVVIVGNLLHVTNITSIVLAATTTILLNNRSSFRELKE